MNHLNLTLYHPGHHDPLLHIIDGQITFAETCGGNYFKETMATSGINIPANQRGEFQGRNNIRYIENTFDEAKSLLFTKAFVNVYFPHALRKQGFSLEDADAAGNMR